MAYTTSDPRIPPVRESVLRDLVDARAAAMPDRVYAVFGDGGSWTFAQLRAEVRRTAAGLAALGLGQGDRLLIALPNGRDALRVWFAANYLGAIAVPFNAAYRGGLIARVCEVAQARLMVCEGALLEHLAAVEIAPVETIVTFGEGSGAPRGVALRDAACLDAAGDTPPDPPRAILPFETQCVIFTSGTTGPSKGVMCSYLHILTAGHAVYFLDESDRYMVNLPMHHVSGVLPCMLMLSLGGSVAVIDRFRPSEFWQTVEATRPSFVILLGVMTRFLLSQPEHRAERAGILRKALLQPLDEDAPEVRRRFNVDLYTSFNMTEISLPIVSEPNPEVPGSCGRVRAGVEVRIVDEWDCEVPEGSPGELIIRADRPWAMTHGYMGDGEATARAWRNGWFHTGDLFRRDAEGNYFFIDRVKDCIRRRGENISSFEVEAAILAHPSVREVAAVAVPSEISENEVLAVLSLIEGATLDPAELIAFLRPRLPYFMIPRYLRLIDDLPKTPTQKIQKHVLRTEGLGAPGIWDREAAGVSLRGEAGA